ncbi:uncharacterized protein LOC142494672 [Ascaphus truei]|uniref:uncharacterized protein LOC142494672 n=1 Tax=Ascaphus truei TaxID=8439 RepID=UPI003F5A26C9
MSELNMTTFQFPGGFLVVELDGRDGGPDQVVFGRRWCPIGGDAPTANDPSCKKDGGLLTGEREQTSPDTPRQRALVWPEARRSPTAVVTPSAAEMEPEMAPEEPESISRQRSGKETPPPPYSRQAKTEPAESERERLAAYLPVRGPDDPSPPLPVLDALPVRDHGADGDSAGTNDDDTSGSGWHGGPAAIFAARGAAMAAALATLDRHGIHRGARNAPEKTSRKMPIGRGITRLLDIDTDIADAPVPTPSAIAPVNAPAPSRVMTPGPSGDKLSKNPKYSKDWRDWELSDEGSDGEVPYDNVIRTVCLTL